MSNTIETIAAACANRMAFEIDKGLTEKNREFIAKQFAFFKTPAFAALADECKINVGFIDGSNGAERLAVYALERLAKVCKYTLAGISEPARPTDQYRYAHDLFMSLRSTVAKDKSASLTRQDLRATGTKGESKETETGYADGAISETVKVAGRIMAQGTAQVQTRNTFATFAALGMVEAVCEERGAFRFTAKPRAPFYRKLDKLYTARLAAQQ